ncbi:MAG TPA: PLP-dependent aminotransferase family protein [Telluria sp.]|nr:PLP-dependent aminotransferase family protein [Telluria sp.]
MDYQLLLHDFERRQDCADWPRQRVIHQCLRAAILDGRLATGTRLHASRELARELGIARNTVLYAYEQLAAEGLLATNRRGTVVAPLAPASPRRPAPAAPRYALSGRAQGLRALPLPSSTSDAFASGVPALDVFPFAAWRRSLERAWRSLAPFDLDYGAPAGEPELRAAVADYLSSARGVRCDAEQVFVTPSTQASLDLCARCFADAGATAWIESPGYAGALAAFRAAQLRTVGIAVDGDGIAPSAQDWRRAPPRLIYTTPSHQYPTGGVLSMARRLDLLAHAQRAGALVIEDDYDSEFRHDGPPLAAMQGLVDDAPVIYLGTFSKTLFPALRTAYMVVPPSLVEPLRMAVARLPGHGRPADQRALADFIASGQFTQHLRRMRRLYRQRRDALLDALGRRLGDESVVEGASTGMHLALRLRDPDLSDVAVQAAASGRGIATQAISTHASGLRAHGWNGLLLGYAQVAEDRVDEKVRELAAAIRAVRRA